MTDSNAPYATASASGYNHADLGDYWQLLKPRLMSLSVFTALAGMIAAPGDVHPVIALCALIFIAMGAGGSAALNMWYDADIDMLMSRTSLRPLPRGRIPSDEALALGMVLSIGSVFSLGVLVNWMAAGLLGLTIVYYALIYTAWLKRRTAQNIVIGGAAGAFPPMIGWAVATGGVSWDSALLFLIIFIWTPPHFWALALLRTRDYERAGVPMLPVVAGPAETRRQILIYTLLLAPTGMLPYFTGLGGPLYLTVSALGGAVFLALAILVWRTTEGPAALKRLRQLFGFSILYLFALFGAILVEHGLGLVTS